VRYANEAASRTHEHAALKKLKSALHGQMIMEEDAGYDKARKVFNGWVDRRPTVIVKAADASDVSRVVNHARDLDLRLAIRSGGHDIGGYSVVEWGVVLDLRELKSMEIDPRTCTAWAGTGLTAGEYTLAAAKFDLATGFGDTATVGIGGITLGGGVGYLVRKHGMTIDHLLAAELVSADGRLLHVDADHHPDLFWAIRGGGGNFGVATRFQFKLHPVSQVYGGMLLLPATVDTLCAFFAEAEAAPEELSIIANVMHAPPMPFIPQQQVGKPMILALMVYAGDIETGQHAVAPLRRLAVPIADMLRPMSYPEMYQLGGPEPANVAVRSMFLDRIDRDAAKEILSRLETSTTPMSVAQFRVLGGAMARVPDDATSFVHRTRKMMAGVMGMYDRPEERPMHEAWVTAFAAALDQGTPGVYVNFLGDEGAARVREAYPGPTWDRLREVKRRYDPTNFFRMNQNIPPATA